MNDKIYNLIENEEGTLHISLLGEIDHHSAVKLRNDVDAETYSRKPKKVIN